MKGYKFEISTEDGELYDVNTNMNGIHIEMIIGFLEMEKSRLVKLAETNSKKALKLKKQSKRINNDK